MSASSDAVPNMAADASSARTPAELKEKLEHLTASTSLPTEIVVHLYHSLFEGRLTEAETQAWEGSNLWGRKVVDPIFAEWAAAIKEAILPEPPEVSTPVDGPRIRFIFDVRRPPHLAHNFLGQHHTRGLHRITALIEKRLRSFGPLEAVICGVKCWCMLQATKKHIAMPQGVSYPVHRVSHGKWELEEIKARWRDPEYERCMLGGSDLGYEERMSQDFKLDDAKGVFDRKCLKLAREHWDDEYWLQKKER